MIEEIDVSKIKVISYSIKPKNEENSYMPVFVVGKGQAFVLSKIILDSSSKYKLNNIIITGGVAANSILRKNLQIELIKENINLHFPNVDLCTDNAVGIAYMGKYK